MCAPIQKAVPSNYCTALRLLEKPMHVGHPICLLYCWHRDLDELQGLSRLNFSSCRVQAALRVSGRIGRKQ